MAVTTIPSPATRYAVPVAAAVALIPLATPVVVVGAATGLLAGALGRQVLSRLRRPIALRRGWCEIPLALLWAVTAFRWESGGFSDRWLPVALVVGWFAVTLTAADLATRRLPHALTLTAYPALGLPLVIAHDGASFPWWRPLVAMAALLLVHAAVHLIRPGTLGAGDVLLVGSLALPLGALGLPALLLALFAASVVTLLLAHDLPLRRRHPGSGVPHGPGLLIATTVAALFPTLPL